MGAGEQQGLRRRPVGRTPGRGRPARETAEAEACCAVRDSSGGVHQQQTELGLARQALPCAVADCSTIAVRGRGLPQQLHGDARSVAAEVVGRGHLVHQGPEKGWRGGGSGGGVTA
jgi:hypothetical protein